MLEDQPAHTSGFRGSLAKKKLLDKSEGECLSSYRLSSVLCHGIGLSERTSFSPFGHFLAAFLLLPCAWSHFLSVTRFRPFRGRHHLRPKLQAPLEWGAGAQCKGPPDLRSAGLRATQRGVLFPFRSLCGRRLAPPSSVVSFARARPPTRTGPAFP